MKIALACFAGGSHIAAANNGSQEITEEGIVASLNDLPFFLKSHSVIVVTNASSFALVQRWTALLDHHEVDVVNLGSCGRGASLQRTLEAWMAALQQKPLNESILMIPVPYIQDIDWDLIERVIKVCNETTIQFLNSRTPTRASLHPHSPISSRSASFSHGIPGSSNDVAAFYATSGVCDILDVKLNALPLSSRLSDSDSDSWTQIVSLVGPDFKTVNCSDLDVFHQIHAVSAEALAQSSTPTVASAYARVGLMGNPSDGFFGKTISLLIKNFHATVTITPNASPSDQTITIQQTPLLDPFQFASLAQLSASCEKNGYYGVQRLMLAAAKVFGSYCKELGVHSVEGGVLRGFRVDYETNIPRQVGLAGSSALITAFIRSLVLYYGLDNHPGFPPHVRANLALSAEKDELDIAAGLQDRVIQAYGGLVFMDFNRDLMESRGYGNYERLPLSLVPKGLWIAYVGVPSDSGKIHTNVRARFFQGDQEVITAMDLFADLATRAKTALLKHDATTFAELMDTNFATRRSLYGDAVVGADNLAVVKIAHEFGHAAKFSGSGGCVVGLRKVVGHESLEKRREMKKRIRALGYVFEELVVGDEVE
ncbi:UNVERIFIED_CONTAM: hypothetical protein HDU68_003158 [Siphonaria sp. JEL0065]|nr:hypothetical protein HDU68_003158 [Siphonaria sp. JEL0065]